MVTMRMAPATRLENAVDLGGVRVTHQRRLVGSAPHGGQPGTFEMDPVEQARTNVVGQLPDLTQQVGRAGGDQGGDECGGAVPAVKSHGGGGLVVGRGGEVRPSPAVQVCVDEARHHRHRAEFAIRGPGRSARADRIDHALGHLNPAGPQQFSAREQGVGGHQQAPQMPCHSGLER